MRGALASLLVLGLLAGCFAPRSRPLGTVGFGRASTLQDLEGTYRNLGEGGRGRPPVYLSEVIPAWSSALPMKYGIAHASIEAVKVLALGDSALRVSALGQAGVLREQTFVRGREFEFRGGRIRLHHELGTVHEREIMAVAVKYTTVELGVDQARAGKYQFTGVGAALLAYFIPFVGGGGQDARFVRIEGR